MVASPRAPKCAAVFSDTRLSRTLPTVALRSETLSEGTRIGGHVIDGWVAAGGMGVVYRAHHASSGQSVAIKVMHQSLTQQRASLRCFEREARAVDALRHPNIVAGFDCGQLGDGVDQVVGGALLSTDEWTAAAPGAGLRASDAALDGLDPELRRRTGG